jgi:hypothetical protein
MHVLHSLGEVNENELGTEGAREMRMNKVKQNTIKSN